MSAFGSGKTFGSPAATTTGAKDVAFPQDSQDTISSLSWSPVSNHLAAASWDSKVYIYDATNSSAIKGISMITTQGPVLDCHFSKDGTLVAAAGADKKLHVLDAASGKTLTFDGHEAPIRSVRFVDVPSVQAPIIATGSWDKTVRFWDMRQPTAMGSVQCDERVYSMDAGGQLLVVAVAEGKVHLVDLNNPMAIAQTVKSPLSFQTRSVAAAPDGSRWGIGSIEGRAGVQAVQEKDKSINLTWRCHRETPASTSRNREVKIWAVNDVTFMPTDKDIFATAGSDGTFAFWDVKAKSRLKQFPDVGGSITAAAFNRDGTGFAYAVGYDWSKGYAHNSASYPNKIMVHPIAADEVKKKK